MIKNGTYQVLEVVSNHQNLTKNSCGTVSHDLHCPLAKFHFDTSNYSKEIIKKVTSNMH